MPDINLLSLKPIRLNSIGTIGFTTPQLMNTLYDLSKILTQNILYITYYEPKSVSEIADMLGLNQNLVEYEVKFLEYSGFLDIIYMQTKSFKYLSNIFISDFPPHISEKLHIIYSKYAKIICEKYISQITNTLSPIPCPLSPKIYIPQNDSNFLLWSLITFACQKKLSHPLSPTPYPLSNYNIKRADGSDCVLFTSVQKDEPLSFKEEMFRFYGGTYTYNTTPSGNTNLYVWHYNSYFDDRRLKWGSVFPSDFINLYYVFKNQINNDEAQQDILHRLSQNGFLIDCVSSSDSPVSLRADTYFTSTFMPPDTPPTFIPPDTPPTFMPPDTPPTFMGGAGGGKSSEFRIPNSEFRTPNMVVTTLSSEELINYLPPVPENILDLQPKLTSEIFDTIKAQYPDRMQDLCYAICQNALNSNDMITRILHQCLVDGVLKPLTDVQRKTVNAIMFSDVLPDLGISN